ncbi:MAG: hypothetical protein SGJ23_07255 [Alphaproteobacteria bacterium]|nr:hypothetical protein [Alphaproteobacteria bacterium]
MTNVWNPTPPAVALPESARLALNVAAPAVLVMAANAVLMLFGGGADLPRFENLAVAPPDWASAVAWIGVLAALGLSRFELLRTVESETLAIDALLIAVMVYPFTATAFGADWTAANSLTLLAITVMALVAAFPQSKSSAGWLVPVTGWLGWTSWLAVADAAG